MAHLLKTLPAALITAALLGHPPLLSSANAAKVDPRVEPTVDRKAGRTGRPKGRRSRGRSRGLKRREPKHREPKRREPKRREPLCREPKRSGSRHAVMSPRASTVAGTWRRGPASARRFLAAR